MSEQEFDDELMELAEQMAEEAIGAPSNEEEEICLEKLAAADEKLWDSAHTSDDEAFDPENPEDLKTASAKMAEECEVIEKDSASDEEEEDDSIVCDKVEDACAQHAVCIGLGEELDRILVEQGMFRTSKKKECRSALAEAICDHYSNEK